MKTPKEYANNIKNGIITHEMMGACIYSMNKRAKNCRDKQREYRDKRDCNPYLYDKYHYDDYYNERKENYYEKKDILLALFSPNAIHIVHHSNEYTEYFLYYEIGKYSFHTPISDYIAQKEYPNLKQMELDNFVTCGRDIKDLISCQFVNKVLDLIEYDDYTLVS